MRVVADKSVENLPLLLKGFLVEPREDVMLDATRARIMQDILCSRL
jgi:hypothetical protein